MRGYQAYDLDTLEWSEWIAADSSDALTPAEGKDWVWREGRIRALLSKPEDGKLFISGCAENMKQLFPLIIRSHRNDYGATRGAIPRQLRPCC